MNNNLLILGAGGHGRVVKETAQAMGCFDRIEFLDDNSKETIGKCKDFKQFIRDFTYAFVAFGNNELRLKWIEELNEAGFQLPVLIHPTSYISPSAKIGAGTIVESMAVVNTNAIIDKGCILSIGALVDHDSIVSECTHINSGAIVKAGCKVNPLTKVDAGMVHSVSFSLTK